METKKIVLTDNMTTLIKHLEKETDFISAIELKAKYYLDKSIQSINGSLSASAYNNILFTKSTKVLDNKIVKCYKLTDTYKNYIN